tara:strand:- start:226 stop:690 length:465 start_codon:yes stop_codon:yes gene_type:complete
MLKKKIDKKNLLIFILFIPYSLGIAGCSQNKTNNHANTHSLTQNQIFFDKNMVCSKKYNKLNNKKILYGGVFKQPKTYDSSEIKNKIIPFVLTQKKLKKPNIKYGCITTQLVAGINYSFILETNNKNKYQIIVWEKLDRSYKLTSFEKLTKHDF